MTKHLFLVRHAHAESPTSVLRDVDRELNSTGLIEASRMGRKLQGLHTKLDLIMASYSRRTVATAELIAEQIGYETDAVLSDPNLYDASMRNLMHIINTIDEKYADVMIVAHNPTLTYLAEFLTQEEMTSLPPCGVVSIEFSNLPWAEITGKCGKLIWFEYPEKESD